MDVVHARCGGIDVHQASLAICVSIKEAGKSEKHKLRCGTTTAELMRLADWLKEHGVTHVAMEATGVYWKPVWHVLEGQFELLLANPTQVKALRGRKTDVKDGERIADFLQHGLLQGSFVVCWACSAAWRCKSSGQPDGGEGLEMMQGLPSRGSSL